MKKHSSIARLLVLGSLAVISTGVAQELGAPVGLRSQSCGGTTERYYTLTARVRLLPFIWISREGVGEARISWIEETEGARGLELLIGSDPARAPMRINRWGYVAERVGASSAELLGVMTASDEQSVEQAKDGVSQGGAKHTFKAIRGRVSEGNAQSTVIRLPVADNFTYRDLAALLQRLPQTGPATKQTRIPDGTEPGFLFALRSLVHDSVESYRQSGCIAAGARPRRVFVYDVVLFDLTQKSSRFLPEIVVHGRTYHKVIESAYESRNKTTGKTSGFVLTYGTQDLIAETPVRILYRPRGWFEVELLLDGKGKAAEVAAR